MLFMMQGGVVWEQKDPPWQMYYTYLLRCFVSAKAFRMAASSLTGFRLSEPWETLLVFPLKGIRVS